DVNMRPRSKGVDIRMTSNMYAGHWSALIARKHLSLPHLKEGYPAIMQDLVGKKIGVTVLVERRSDGLTPIKGNRWLEQFIRFTPLGSLNPQNGASMGGTLHVCARDQALSHYQLVLAKTGRIRLEKREIPEALCTSPGLQQGANA
ncbi:MAG: hypothetical protein ACLPL7_20890, partial [Pseudomonas sp.]